MSINFLRIMNTDTGNALTVNVPIKRANPKVAYDILIRSYYRQARKSVFLIKY